MKRITLFLCILGLFISKITSAQTANAPIDSTHKMVNSHPSGSENELIQKQDRTSTFTLSGRIVDSDTGKPLSYATISIKALGISVVSNQDGNWSIKVPANGVNAKLNVVFMGYSPNEFNISGLSDYTVIKLSPARFELAEVVVRPRDFIAELLSKAYKAIPENYPTKATLSSGFYRETQKVNDSLFLYFDEAMLDVYKNTYKNNKNFGQIRIEKSRKNVFPGIDSINDVRFYGGPHFPNDLDIVFSRWDFIKPSEYKNWVFQLGGVYKDSLSEVYTISFRNRKAPNSNFQGQIFIDRDNYAYVGFELKRAGLNTLDMEDIPTDAPYIAGNTSVRIGYSEKNGLYNLSYITYNTSGVNTTSKIRIYKDIEYVTTTVKTDSVYPIPFSQQFDYTDILSIEADNYDQSYWKDYNILQESTTLSNQTKMLYQKEQAMEQLTKAYNRELTQQEKTLLILKRFTFDGGIGFHPIRYQGGQHHITYANAEANTSVPSTYFGLSTMDGVRFELTKKWNVFSTISAALYGISQIQFDLGLSLRSSLIPGGRWVFLDLGLAASTINSKLDICTLNNPDANLKISGKTFDSKTIDVKAGKSSMGMKPVVGLAVRMGKKYELFADGSYYFPLLFKRDYVQLKESEGFFMSRKSVKLDWNDSNLNFQVNNNSITSPHFEVEPYQFRLGIRSSF